MIKRRWWLIPLNIAIFIIGLWLARLVHAQPVGEVDPFSVHLNADNQPSWAPTTTKVTNLNADQLDGKHTGTSGSAIPVMDVENAWSATQSNVRWRGGDATAYTQIDSTGLNSGGTLLSGKDLTILSQGASSGGDGGMCYVAANTVTGGGLNGYVRIGRISDGRVSTHSLTGKSLYVTDYSELNNTVWLDYLTGPGILKIDASEAIAKATSGTDYIENSGQVDHGSVAGLADDDHTQYLLANGTRATTGAFSFGTDGSGQDWTAYSDTAGSKLFWDASESQLTQTIQNGKGYAFSISGADSVRTLNTAYLTVDVDVTWTGTATGAVPIRAALLDFTDERTVNASGGADYTRVMDFNMYRAPAFSSVEATNFLMTYNWSTSDYGTYTATAAGNTYFGVWLKGAIEPTFTGATSGSVNYTGLNFDQENIGVSYYSTAPARTVTFKAIDVNPTLDAYAMATSGVVYGLYYNAIPPALFANWVVYALRGDMALARDNAKFYQGTGTTGVLDVYLTYTGTYWDFYVSNATTAVRFNQGQINTDFMVYGDDRQTVHFDAQSGTHWIGANTDSTTAFALKDAAGTSDFIYDSTNSSFGFGAAPGAYTVDVSGTLLADDYYSGDGTQGMTGACAEGTSLTVKDGLVTACS